MFKQLALIGALGACGCGVIQTLVPRPRTASSASAATPATAAPAAQADPTLPHLADDGITSDLHRSFVGQIVFAPHQIAKESGDADQLAAEFYADEPIYGRAYLPQSIENVAVYERGSNRPLRTQTRGYRFQLFVDGTRVDQELDSSTVSSERHAATTLQVWPHPEPSDDAIPRGWVELVNKLPAGTHRIRLELWAHDRYLASRAPLAAGELTLHKDANMTLGSGRTFETLDHGMVEPTLQRELVGIVRGFARKESWKESFTDVAIRSPDWVQIRHKTRHHVIGRRLDAWARAEWPDGHCTAQAVVFEQHVERGQPSGPLYVGSTGEQRLVDCSAAANVAAVDHWHGKTRAKPTPTGAAGPAPAPTAVAQATGTLPPPAITPSPLPVPAAPEAQPTPVPSHVPASAAAAEPPAAPSNEMTAAGARRERPRSGRVDLGIGVAANARESAAVASFAHAGVHLGRLQLGAGATWPLNVLAYARFTIVEGRFELAPMVSATLLGETDMATDIALGGGLSVAYRIGDHVGLRLDALVAYDLNNAGIAVPVLGSTFVRF